MKTPKWEKKFDKFLNSVVVIGSEEEWYNRGDDITLSKYKSELKAFILSTLEEYAGEFKEKLITVLSESADEIDKRDSVAKYGDNNLLEPKAKALLLEMLAIAFSDKKDKLTNLNTHWGIKK